MNRSGYTDDYDDDCHNLNLWRGSVERALRGKRGQAFLREMAAALDAMPEKELIAGELVQHGQVCAIGAVALARKQDVSDLDPGEPEDVAKAFGIAPAMVREITYENDERPWGNEPPDVRWKRMRQWVEDSIVNG